MCPTKRTYRVLRAVETRHVLNEPWCQVPLGAERLSGSSLRLPRTRLVLFEGWGSLVLRPGPVSPSLMRRIRTFDAYPRHSPAALLKGLGNKPARICRLLGVYTKQRVFGECKTAGKSGSKNGVPDLPHQKVYKYVQVCIREAFGGCREGRSDVPLASGPYTTVMRTICGAVGMAVVTRPRRSRSRR